MRMLGHTVARQASRPVGRREGTRSVSRTGVRRGQRDVRRYRGSIWGILTVQGLLTIIGPAAIVCVGGMLGHVEVAVIASCIFLVLLVLTAARVRIEIGPSGAVVQNRLRRYLVPPDSSVVSHSYWLTLNGFEIPHFRVDGRLIPIVAAAAPWGRRKGRLVDDLLRTYRWSL